MEDPIFDKSKYRTLDFSSDSVCTRHLSSDRYRTSALLVSMISVSDRTYSFNLIAHFLLRRCLVVAMFAAPL